ncbi:MAG TPA: protein translocase subunit SecF [Candidatus Moranbacteria bacterium]|nr:protein translocase subunit SecF [Candidatus Moranbacteria bacterium]
MLNIIQKRKYTYIFSATLVVISIVLLLTQGLKLGRDFKGGTLLEVQFTPKTVAGEKKQSDFKSPSRDEILKKLSDLKLKDLMVQPSNNNKFILRYMASDENLNEQVLQKLGEFGDNVQKLRVDFVGASISKQLKKKAVWAIVLAVVGIAGYIAWAFRKVSYPIASWQYGVGAIIALAHDIIITLGAFVLLGKFYGVEIGIPFIAALLTILGYSVNDTIVVYDRIRENLIKSNSKENFENIVNKSIKETLARSINTSATVIFVLLTMILFGGESIKYFSIALLIGVGFGTYSSIFVASALLVSSYNFNLKKG